MTLEEKASKISSGLWLDQIDQLRAAASQNFQGGDLAGISERLQVALEKKQRGRALNWLSLGLLIDQSRMLDRIRRSGLLRSSKYSFDSQVVEAVCRTVVKSSDLLGLSPATDQYLASISSLLTLAPAVRRKRANLISLLRSERHRSLKSLIVIVDLLFLVEYVGDRHHGSKTLSHFSKEDIAEAFSYLLFLYDKHIGLGDRSFLLVDTDGVRAGKYDSMLLDAALIRVYLECEILVDAFAYTCEVNDADHTVRVRSLEARLEQSIRFGYIQREMQILVDESQEEERAREEKIVSLRQMAKELLDNIGKKFITLEKQPLPRFVYPIPATDEVGKFLSEQRFFREEAALVSNVSREYFVEFGELADMKVQGSVTVWDLLKCHRIVNIFRWYVCEHLLRAANLQSDVVLQSLIPVFTRQSLLKLFSSVLDETKASEAVECLTWRSGSPTVFDIQYQPIIAAGEFYVVPMNVYGSSAAVRNALQLTHKRPDEQIGGEPIGNALVSRFLRQDLLAVPSFEYDFNGRKGEIDALSVIDDTLFVFECKNSLLPCNVHELRTTYEHVRHAAEQLDIIVGLFESGGFAEYICARNSWRITPPSKIVTCVVLSNKMFSGWRIRRHPVRSLLELGGFVWPGKLGVGDNLIALRPAGQLGGQDLAKYLENDRFHRIVFDCMRETSFDYDFGNGTTLSLATYFLDLEVFDKQVGAALASDEEQRTAT